VAIGVGVVLATVMLGALFHSAEAFTLVIAALAGVGAYETGRTFREAGRPFAVPVVIVAVAASLFGTYRAGAAGQTVGVLVLFAGAVAWELADHDRERVLGALGVTMFVGLWTGYLGSFGVLLATRPGAAPVITLAVLGGAIFGDIGGYLFGSLFGRHRIAPSVSPNKTWEGLLGGLALAAAGAWFVLPLLGSVWVEHRAEGVVVAVLSALAGFFGDLVESMVKRDLGVKDLGRILPGHGGILDRVDGILIALPVGYYAVVLLL
jgi:phosphatidate cytidylyltransferase